jgi:hypothetical protein
MPRTQWSTEDVYVDALQDPHDKGKAGLLETQSPIGAACPPSLPRLKRCHDVRRESLSTDATSSSWAVTDEVK